MTPYTGRFAPSPTGPLHAGSVATALASWLDARAHGGRWLVRIEDVDRPRCEERWTERILWQLSRLSLNSDGPVLIQSQHSAVYQQWLDGAISAGQAYPCTCSRSEVAARQASAGRRREKNQALEYDAWCRDPKHRHPDRLAAWRFAGPDLSDESAVKQDLQWQDRLKGLQTLPIEALGGDFVAQRADGCWTYQWAVVIDDERQGITDVIRGEDLLVLTPRQKSLQRALGFASPRYGHTPLVCAADGHKLSKQNGAQEVLLDTEAPLAQALNQAAHTLSLGLPADICSPRVWDSAKWLEAATRAWRQQWVMKDQPLSGKPSIARA